MSIHIAATEMGVNGNETHACAFSIPRYQRLGHPNIVLQAMYHTVTWRFTGLRMM